MNNAVKKECIGLTWDADNRCAGVRVRSETSGFTVVAHWESQADSADMLPELARNCAEKLGATADLDIVAGGLGVGTGTIDITVPDASSDELRNLLGYELRKYAAVPPDEIVWAYRLLPLSAESGPKTARLYYVRDIAWGHWLDIIAALPDGAGALIPPSAALDPVLSDCDLFLKTGDNRRGYIMARNENGDRQTLLADKNDAAACFGGGPSPLRHADLDGGSLDNLPAGEQSRYTGALVLALYGLGGSRKADRKTSLPIPSHLQQKGHGLFRKIAVGLTVYVALAIAFSGGRYYLDAMSSLKKLDARLAQVTKHIDTLSFEHSADSPADDIESDFKSLQLTRPSLPESLLELTRRFGEEYWVSNMQWNEGKIELDVRTAVDDLSFVKNLAASPLFTDVIPTRKVIDSDGKLAVSVHLNTVLANDMHQPASANTAADGTSQASARQ